MRRWPPPRLVPRRPAEQRAGGGAAPAHPGAAGSWKAAGRAWGLEPRLCPGKGALGPGMGAGPAEGLARRLRAALRAEEPSAVDELLLGGADPNLVLPDGVAAVHLAAGARRPRGLRCLGLLLLRGGDPNVRSAEALTPLHVAAAWGCRRGLELLLSRGGDPELCDQDGLRPLDLAEQQGHHDCARVLRHLHTQTRSPSEAKPARCFAGGAGDAVTSRPAAGADSDPPAPPSSPTSSQEAEPDGRPASPQEPLDGCCSDTSFVTAVESLDPEDSSLRLSPCTGSLSALPRVPSVLLDDLHGMQVHLLDTRLRALSVTSPAASCPASSHSQGTPGGPCPVDDSTDKDPAILWGTEDKASLPGGRDPELSDLELLRRLRALGENPGPITPFTRRHYLRRLQLAEAVSAGCDFTGRSPELAEALRTGRIPDARVDEDTLIREFARPDPGRRWREGVAKSSFTYLLLDPRETQDLPARAASLSPAQRLQSFVGAVFYVGKGTRARPNVHLWEALGYHRGRPGKAACPKVRYILDIWASGRGVVSLHCFQHVVAVEAYTREACLVDALGIETLTNQKQGHCYGVVASWPPAQRRRLGVHLLYRALLVFLAEGERELRPQDIQARG
ncbi:ankyrin repeat and LEM domain-containing protein 1 [Ochotona princeps]|uniref:ankyrin repeat and LEM domain-containing protein 1 n=1 Tax=Ochotona princeps TaxID=9978 RepID=UPI0027144C5E|nr:ankyrin repeat and LEM domain-containing protein 1 [Ochotona princeps]